MHDAAEEGKIKQRKQHYINNSGPVCVCVCRIAEVSGVVVVGGGGCGGVLTTDEMFSHSRPQFFTFSCHLFQNQ